MLGTANLAYRRAVQKTREAANEAGARASAPWLAYFDDELPENDSGFALQKVAESERHRKERLLRDSPHPYYNRFAWSINRYVTSTAWFETVVMAAILLVGVATALDLETDGDASATVIQFIELTSLITTIIFTIECCVKIIAEGPEPLRYFTHPEDGYFNTFDFFIVVCTYAMSGGSGAAIAGLRMLRLVRLLTLIKSVPVLRAIISGLVVGMKSVFYIVILLWLVIYIFAILGCGQFGANDPARFGTVRISSKKPHTHTHINSHENCYLLLQEKRCVL